MNIHIISEDYYKDIDSYDSYKIEQTRDELKSLGFNPKILKELPKDNKEDYFLLFHFGTVPFEVEDTKRVVWMDNFISQMLPILEEYKFPILVERNKYVRDIPSIIGKKAVAEAAGLSFIASSPKAYKEYAFINNKEEKGLINLIVTYLKKYDELEKVEK